MSSGYILNLFLSVAEHRKQAEMSREPPRHSLDIAPMVQEVTVKTEESIQKKKKGQKIEKEDMKKEIDIVCY
jgi:hypothetical protein